MQKLASPGLLVAPQNLALNLPDPFREGEGEGEGERYGRWLDI